MPQCIQFTPKGETEPSTLQKVDEALCQHFGAAVHPDVWFQDWYNCEAMLLAMGRSFDYLREKFPERKRIIDFLEQTYDVRVWWQGH